MDASPTPFETEDPEYGELVEWFCRERPLKGTWKRLSGVLTPKGVYVLGRLQAEPKMDVPRNAPCPCGSGKKAKKCCGA